MNVQDFNNKYNKKEMTITYNDRMKWLKSRGCYPSIYRRGDMWRAHVNAAGNFWADARTPYAALEKAVQLWREKGCPKDGMACS